VVRTGVLILTLASVAWQPVLHMIGNASILLEFDVTATPPR